jgi:iron complex transport system ATP-binding protein
MILNVSGLTFSYNSHPVIDGVAFSLAPGELLAVLGPNGVGKTTLLKCINAIHRPTGGTVLLHGKDILELSPMQIARRIGYVAQRTDPSRVTVFDAVLMGRRPHIRWGVSKKDLKIVDAALRRLGINKLSLRYIDELSGGELQKVAIGRALVQEPRLILLDEPTSNLDLKNQVEVLTMVRHVVVEHKMAAIMTLHDLNAALRYAHKCIFLKNGSIFYAGPTQDVDAAMIEAVYGLPVELYRKSGRLLVTPRDP